MSTTDIYQNDQFTLYATHASEDQLYIAGRNEDPGADPSDVCMEIYNQILKVLKKSEMQIVQERLFGSNSLYQTILDTRNRALVEHEISNDLPLTYIQGHPCWGTGFAGVQMQAILPEDPEKDVWTIYDGKVPVGRGWRQNGTKFIMLHNIHGLNDHNSGDRSEQTSRMFAHADQLLKTQNASFSNVVRTWIYLSDILDWYGDFNKVRNEKFREFGLFTNGNAQSEAEDIYMPASTGIEGNNPMGASGIMDALAVLRGPDSSVQIMQTFGTEQKSPYRYGSAFSRAMTIQDPKTKHIYLSGTASIDEKGNSVHIGDVRAQIIKTLEVVEALIAEEGATLHDICKTTVFLKHPEDMNVYNEVISEYGLSELPSVCVVADVCREELLFELDAIVVMIR